MATYTNQDNREISDTNYLRYDLVRKRLEKINGVKVVDMKYRALQDYMSLSDLRYVNTTASVERDYTVDWIVMMDDRTANDFIDVTEKLKWLGVRFAEFKQKLQLTESDLQSLRGRIKKLEDTLKENPGIREQWDEMMTMLKLAGYTDDLID